MPAFRDALERQDGKQAERTGVQSQQSGLFEQVSSFPSFNYVYQRLKCFNYRPTILNRRKGRRKVVMDEIVGVKLTHGFKLTVNEVLLFGAEFRVTHAGPPDVILTYELCHKDQNETFKLHTPRP